MLDRDGCRNDDQGQQRRMRWLAPDDGFRDGLEKTGENKDGTCEREQRRFENAVATEEAALEGKRQRGDAGGGLQANEHDVEPAAAFRHLEQESNAGGVENENEGHEEG